MRRRDRALVMGVLNVTPDSFSDGGRFATVGEAIEAALQMVLDGVDIIDVGGESSRPGAKPISVEEELRRILPVVRGIRKRSEIPLSIDTTKADVARAALEVGTDVINDISALRGDQAMPEVVAESDALLVLMHMKGAPQSMQTNPAYEDVVEEVFGFLHERIRVAEAEGIPRDRLWIDPGIGFGKRIDHNVALLRNLNRFTRLGLPILVGLSRKSFLGRLLELPVEERLEGTLAANAVAIARGAEIIRVHDVKEGRRTADVAYSLRRAHA